MICTHCGKVLKEYDRFCSNCGAVIEQEEEKEFVFTAPERDFEWNVHSFPDGSPHKTEDIDFDWGIKEGEFRRRPRTEENTFLTPKVAPVPGVEQMQEVNAESSVPDIQQPEFVVPAAEMPQPTGGVPVQEMQQDEETGKVATPSFVADMVYEETKDETDVVSHAFPGEKNDEVKEKPKEKKGFFSRFTKDKTETAEQPVITDEMIQEASASDHPEEAVIFSEADNMQDVSFADQPDVLSESVITKNHIQEESFEQIPETPEPDPETPESDTEIPEPDPETPEPKDEPIYKAEHVHFDWTQSMDPHQEFMAMVEKQERETAGQMPHISELRDEKEDDIKGEELERELFGGAAVAGVVDGGEGLSRHSAKIDKFYTFNKKNEEFQKLLDNEYERFREGRPLDNDTFSANVEAIRASAENSDYASESISGLDEIEAINDTIKVEHSDKYEDKRRTMPYHIVSDENDTVPLEQENDLPQTEQTDQESQQYPRQATMPQFAMDPEPEMMPGLERLPEMEKTQEEIDQDKLNKIKEIFGIDQNMADAQQMQMGQQLQNQQAENEQEQMFYAGQPQAFQPQQGQGMTGEYQTPDVQGLQSQNTQSQNLQGTQHDQNQMFRNVQGQHAQNIQQFQHTQNT